MRNEEIKMYSPETALDASNVQEVLGAQSGNVSDVSDEAPGSLLTIWHGTAIDAIQLGDKRYGGGGGGPTSVQLPQTGIIRLKELGMGFVPLGNDGTYMALKYIAFSVNGVDYSAGQLGSVRLIYPDMPVKFSYIMWGTIVTGIGFRAQD